MVIKGSGQIVGFINNILFMPGIEKAAAQLGYQVTWVERMNVNQAVGSALSLMSEENRAGSTSGLLDLLTRTQPVLLIFDLDNHEIPWKEVIAWITSIPETRRIPVICFGPHVNVEAFKLAKNLGSAAVFARSRFLADLPVHIQKFARSSPLGQISRACEEPISELARLGIELFNQGQYFEAHEELELAWKADRSEARELYRGILQVGIAYLQIERGNYRGAVKMLLRVRQWLHPLPDVCRGVNVNSLRQDAERVYLELVRLGEPNAADFDKGLFGQVIFV